MSTPTTRPDLGTWRRQRAWELHQEGWWSKDIAAVLGVSQSAVSQWLTRARAGGAEALRTQSRPGPTPRLTAEQWAQIPGLLTRGAEAYGFRGDVWTANRIADVIWRTFGVRYHRDHVSRLLRQIGWSRQQPIERATHRNEQAIEQWKGERWPAIKKSRRGRVYHRLGGRVWLQPVPLAVRTWAPCGQTPVLRVPLTHDHLSVISGITLDGRLFLQMQEQTYTAETVVGFLRALLRKIRGKVLVIWDGSPIHKGQPIKDFLAHGAAKGLHLERLPGYAPDLNPDEGIWNYLKRVELKNCCCRDLAQLRLELRRATERLRHKRHIIQGCAYQCGYAK
jgi:transposase